MGARRDLNHQVLLLSPAALVLEFALWTVLGLALVLFMYK